MPSLVSKLIRERRELAGLRQGDLADRLGVTRNTIIRWEKNHNPPTAPQRRKLAKELGGHAEEYGWSDADFEYRDKLTRIKLDVNVLKRRLEAEAVGS